jgi:hypothetical protein
MSVRYEGILGVALLNDQRRLVASHASLGPFVLPKVMFSSGYSSLLLPWPSSEDETKALQKLIRAPGSTAFIVDGQMEHSTLVLSMTEPLSFQLNGKEVVQINTIHFALTVRGAAWVTTQGIEFNGVQARLFAANLEYAIIGQSVLSVIRTYQSFQGGMVLLDSKLSSKFLPSDLDSFILSQKQAHSQSKNWIMLKDLGYTASGISLSDRLGTRLDL